MSRKLKILFFDIETAPLLAHVWSAYTKFVPASMMVHDSFMLCWAAKWADGKQVKSDVLTSQEAQDQDDGRIVASLAELMREADIVVAHNANGFDIPMVNNRLLLLGLEPLGPIRSIDTLKIARRSFRLAHNKLDYLAQLLGLGRKIKTDFDLWLEAYHGNTQALKQMLKYNKHDVELLEEVYYKLEPYAQGYISRLVDGDSINDWSCPHCGSDEMQKRGYYRTQGSTFQQYQCQECKRYSRDRRSQKAMSPKRYPL